MRLFFVIIFALYSSVVSGQSVRGDLLPNLSVGKADTLSNDDSLYCDLTLSDSTRHLLLAKLDEMEAVAACKLASLTDEFNSVTNAFDIGWRQLQQEIDTLAKLQLPTKRLTAQLDSIQRWKNERIKLITSRADSMTTAVRTKIESLALPPDLSNRAKQLVAQFDKLNVTAPYESLPISFQQKLNLEIPDLSNSLSIPDIPVENTVDLTKLQDVTNVNLPSSDIANIAEQAGQYQSQLSKLPNDLDGAAKIAEDQASSIAVINDVQKEIAQVDDITNLASPLQDEENLKQQLVSEVKQQAVDHLAGKEEQLNKAMESISKYKRKFPTVTSLDDLPKKRPNEMKTKPFIERIIPGIAFQLQKKNDHILLDINPYIAYRFTTRLSAGGGWNQRVGYDTDLNGWSSKDSHIYGPRVFSEYKIGRGFSPRLEVEVMNSFVPPYVKMSPQDLGSREWVWGAFAGIKKDYKFMKKIKGTAMIMFRLFDPHRKSPYADVVNARFGFEFPMKKKVRRTTTTP